MRKQRTEALNFELVVDGTPIEIVAKPYIAANEQPRFRVSYDGSPVHIFGYEPEMGKVIVMDSASEEIHPKIEDAIGRMLLKTIAA
ncbi:hypothetical protein [Flavihumibacter sp. ZG627]|uniref:hypothetical protein n=1 Tax=Flavihumibacter sp. ZG627 TaxID=1463156 RepID=UPI00057D76CD|nr:hypothetical protein [Flavihumibacter sp. ZG627]KIC90840.1 hypothetical protein HY58_07275 [Flavihumibacter sp. ZG627]MCG7856729.1 hypothetical protein [Flavihumibacter sediminis]